MIAGFKKMGKFSFKTVVQPTDLFVDRCDPSVDVHDSKQHILYEFNVTLKVCICLSREQANIKSMKITLKATEAEKMLDAARWQEYVIV